MFSQFKNQQHKGKQQINTINSILGTPMTAEQYAIEWKGNSKFFSENGYYSWMTSQLGAASTIVEIGCGSGGGSIVLSKQADRVISIEANEDLANTAQSYLTENGVPANITTLDEILNTGLPDDKIVTIIIANVFDERVKSLLESIGVDAVICWLIGAAPGLISDHFGKSLELFTGPEMPEYRIRIHERCYQLGVSILKQNGVVHIVDRLGLNSWTQKDFARAELIRHHDEISEGKYIFDKNSTFLKRVEKSFATSNIQYLVPPGADPSAVVVLSSIKGEIKMGGDI